MALYEYSAYDSKGKKQRGVVEAQNQKSASRKLRDQGIFPTRLVAIRSAVGTAQRAFFRRVSALQLGVRDPSTGDSSSCRVAA